MQSINCLKILGLVVAAIFFSACNGLPFFKNSNANSSGKDSFSLSSSESEIPFSTKEPENYQVDLVSTFQDEFGEIIEQKHKIFKANGNYRVDFSLGETEIVSSIQTAEHKHFISLKEKKVFAEIERPKAIFTENEIPEDFLGNLLLNESTRGTKFESLGEENGLKKYRITVESETSSEFKSESFIWVNENFQLPTQMETISSVGAKNTVKLENFQLNVNPNEFVVPQGFQKISEAEMQNSIRNMN